MLRSTRALTTALLASCLVATSLGIVAAGALASAASPITVTGAYMPAPTSKAMASVYLVLHNSSAEAVQLKSVSSPIAKMAMVMAAGSKSMTMAHPSVPAHGSVTLDAKHDYVMLMGLASKPGPGQRIKLRLAFSTGGAVTVEVMVKSGSSGSGAMGM